MITFVTGKPGDGKSMYGVHLIVNSILTSERFIVTNIPLRLAELRAYLCSKGWSGDLNERVMILKHEECFEFYRFRSGSYVLPPSPDWRVMRETDRAERKKEENRKLSRPEFLASMNTMLDDLRQHPEALRPCEYHIDEAHDYFSAREWTDTGRGILWYASKHRHLHDEVVLYTQVMSNVEKQLRGLAQSTYRVRNMYRMRWGLWQRKGCFRWYQYDGAPENISRALKPMCSGTMHLEPKGLAKCYNSAGALGVHDKPEEVKNKAPLPWWTLPAAGVAAVVAVAFTFAIVPRIVASVANRQLKGVTSSLNKSLGLPGVDSAGQKEPALGSANASATRPDAKPVVYIDALWTLGDRYYVQLTDGRKLQGIEILEVGDEWIRTNRGEVIVFKPRKRAG
jgi:Zonular occludens toxin (Zot).